MTTRDLSKTEEETAMTGKPNRQTGGGRLLGFQKKQRLDTYKDSGESRATDWHDQAQADWFKYNTNQESPVYQVRQQGQEIDGWSTCARPTNVYACFLVPRSACFLTGHIPFLTQESSILPAHEDFWS